MRNMFHTKSQKTRASTKRLTKLRFNKNSRQFLVNKDILVNIGDESNSFSMGLTNEAYNKQKESKAKLQKNYGGKRLFLDAINFAEKKKCLYEVKKRPIIYNNRPRNKTRMILLKWPKSSALIAPCSI